MNPISSPSLPTDVVVMGKITSESCGYCKDLVEDWNVMTSNFAENKRVIVENISSETEDKSIAEINAKYLKASSQKLVRNYYPTIFIIQDGILTFYNKDRSSAALIDVVNKALSGAKTTGGRKRTQRGSRTRRRTPLRSKRRKSRNIKDGRTRSSSSTMMKRMNAFIGKL